MKRTPSAAILSIGLSFAVLGGVALAAQNRSTLKVPNRTRVFRIQRLRELAVCRGQSDRNERENHCGKSRDD